MSVDAAYTVALVVILLNIIAAGVTVAADWSHPCAR